MIRAGGGARARAHTQGGGERRDKVGEGHRHRETHKGERRKEVVVEHIFFKFEKGKRKSCEGGFIFNSVGLKYTEL